MPNLFKLGTVYMTIFVPCDQKTKDIFHELGTSNMKVQRVMPWPDPEFME